YASLPIFLAPPQALFGWRVRDPVRKSPPVRRPAELAQPPDAVGELLCGRAVRPDTPPVPLPRPVRHEREPAPVRRPGWRTRRRLDSPGALPGSTNGIDVHGRAPLTQLRLHHRLRHLDGRPAPVGRDRHYADALDRERELR